LFDLVDDVCHSVFGASLPALVSLEVGLLSKIEEKVLGGKLDDTLLALTPHCSTLAPPPWLPARHSLFPAAARARARRSSSARSI